MGKLGQGVGALKRWGAGTPLQTMVIKNIIYHILPTMHVF